MSVRVLFSGRAAAVPLHNPMGHNDLGGQQIRVFDVVDDLGGRLNPQLEGVDIHAGELRAGQAGEQGVVKGGHRQILRNPQAQAPGRPLQRHRQHIVAGDDGGGPLREGEKGGQLPVVFLRQAGPLQNVLRPDGEAVFGLSQQIPALPVLGVIVLPLVGDIGHPPVAHIQQEGGQLPAGLDVVVIHIDGLAQRLFRLADEDV